MSSDTVTTSFVLDHPIYSNSNSVTESRPAVSDNELNISETITRAIDMNDNLNPIEKAEIKEWIEDKKELRIIATGKTGAGKSSLLNCFIGTKLFTEGIDLDPCTMVMDQHECLIDGIRVIAWDCPGLQDGLDNEEEYLKDLAEKTKRNIDLMLYCIDMSATRATDLRVHGSAIQKLTEILGPGVWSNTVIALTFSNLYVARLQTTNPGIQEEELIVEFNKQVDLWKVKLQQALCDVGVPDIVINALPVCPAGYYTTPHLPGYPLWSSHIWVTMLFAVKEYAQPLPIMLNVRRLRERSDYELSDEHLSLPPQEQPIFISKPLPNYDFLTGSAKKGGGVIGTTVGVGTGGYVGSIVGTGAGMAAGTAGGVVGGLVVGALTLGAGTAVGVAIGAGIGVGIWVATGMSIDLYRKRNKRKLTNICY